MDNLLTVLREIRWLSVIAALLVLAALVAVGIVVFTGLDADSFGAMAVAQVLAISAIVLVLLDR